MRRMSTVRNEKSRHSKEERWPEQENRNEKIQGMLEHRVCVFERKSTNENLGRFTSANLRLYVADLTCIVISILSETSGKWQSGNQNGTSPQKRIKNINRSLENCRVDRSMAANLNFSLIFLLSAWEEWGTIRNQVICAAGLQKGWGTGCATGLWRLRAEGNCRVRLKRPVGSL